MTREILPALKKMMDKWDEEFHSIFGLHVNYFVGQLTVFGVMDFDVLKFDDYLHKLGYSEKADGSMKMYITKRWGERAAELVNELLEAT